MSSGPTPSQGQDSRIRSGICLTASYCLDQAEALEQRNDETMADDTRRRPPHEVATGSRLRGYQQKEWSQSGSLAAD